MQKKVCAELFSIFLKILNMVFVFFFSKKIPHKFGIRSMAHISTPTGRLGE